MKFVGFLNKKPWFFYRQTKGRKPSSKQDSWVKKRLVVVKECVNAKSKPKHASCNVMQQLITLQYVER